MAGFNKIDSWATAIFSHRQFLSMSQAADRHTTTDYGSVHQWMDTQTDAAMANVACSSCQPCNNPVPCFVICDSLSTRLTFSKEKTMNNNTYYGLEEQALGAFGTVRCKECGEWWLEECIPDVCPKCGIRLAAHPGEGFEPVLKLCDIAGISYPIIRCDHCGFRVFGDWKFPECPRCKRPLKHTSKPKKTICARLRKWFGCL